jgi:hypothetical protein
MGAYDDDDDLPPPKRAGSPITGRKPLGKLTQSARGAELKKARNILLVVGILTIGVHSLGYAMAESFADSHIRQELQKQPGAIVDPQFRENLITTVKVFSGALIGVGIIYLVFAMTVQKFPVPITVAGLAIYVGTTAIFAFLNPSQLLSVDSFVRIAIIVGLAQAVQAAFALQREERAARGSGSYA